MKSLSWFMTRKLVAKRSGSMTYDIALATDSHGHEDDLQYAWVYLIRQGREKVWELTILSIRIRFEIRKKKTSER